jgi:hypothetical protein
MHDHYCVHTTWLSRWTEVHRQTPAQRCFDRKQWRLEVQNMQYLQKCYRPKAPSQNQFPYAHRGCSGTPFLSRADDLEHRGATRFLEARSFLCRGAGIRSGNNSDFHPQLRSVSMLSSFHAFLHQVTVCRKSGLTFDGSSPSFSGLSYCLMTISAHQIAPEVRLKG